MEHDTDCAPKGVCKINSLFFFFANEMFPKENQACMHTGGYMVHVQHYAKIQQIIKAQN